MIMERIQNYFQCYLNFQIYYFLVIKEKYLVPPPCKEVEYNFSKKLTNLDINGQEKQPIIINEKIFKNRIKNGFFIEAGAYDGEVFSNTLFYELKQNWTGLLIEPNPDAFEELNKKVSLCQKLFDQNYDIFFIAASQSLAIWALPFYKIETRNREF